MDNAKFKRLDTPFLSFDIWRSSCIYTYVHMYVCMYVIDKKENAPHDAERAAGFAHDGIQLLVNPVLPGLLIINNANIICYSIYIHKYCTYVLSLSILD